MKLMDELDLTALCNGLAELIQQQIGGKVHVRLQKFDRTDAGRVSERMSIAFDVIDEVGSRAALIRLHQRQENSTAGQEQAN